MGLTHSQQRGVIRYGWRPSLLLMGALAAAFLHPAAAPADVFITATGERIENVRVRSFDGTADPRIFDIEKIVDGKASGEFTTLPETRLRRIEFREMEDTEKLPVGRVGHLEGSDDRTYNHLVIESATTTGAELIFRIRQPGEPPGGKAYTAKSSNVYSISFGPAPLSMRHGEQAAALPSPPHAPAGAIPQAEGDETTSREEDATPTDVENSTESPTTDSFFSTFLVLGTATFSVILCALLLVNFVIGTLALLWASRTEGIRDLKLPRALAASALLTIVPQALFIGCLIIPLPLFFVKVIGAFVLWYLSARVIVAGMLEVLEGKANDVLLSYYATFVLLLSIVWIYLQSRT